jgi:hypothetical protein
MNKQYSFIFLIISSSDVPQYLQMKELSKLYYNLFNDKIKHFYIEFKNDLEVDIIEQEDHIYMKGVESIKPGILIKTKYALDYINNKYSYDYVIRTNLSSFWDLNNLLKFKNYLPYQNLCCGHLPFNSFISGTGIIMSTDVSKKITPLMNENISYNDDIYISNLLTNCKYTIQNIENIENTGFTIKYLIYNNNDVISEDTNNILYYRIKNDDRNIDIDMFKKLLLKIYGVI